MSLVLALTIAIVNNHPHVGRDVANTYAKLIIENAKEQKIDYLWIVSRTVVESGFVNNIPSKKDGGKSCGLMQIRLIYTKYTCNQLYNPVITFKLGAKYIAYWIKYEKKVCKNKHKWYLHWIYGYRIPKEKLQIKNYKMDRIYKKYKKEVNKLMKGKKEK